MTQTLQSTAAPVLAALLLSLTAWVGSGCQGSGADSGPRPGTSIGQLAPDFELPRLGQEGRSSLSEYRGKVVLLSFWASWCGPCRQELPELDKAWTQYKGKDVVFLGISVDERPDDAERFLTEVPFHFPTLIDTSGDTSAGQWRVASLPTTVVLDKSGVVRERHLGYTPRQLQESLNLIDDLLEESAP